jgi:TAP-like protein
MGSPMSEVFWTAQTASGGWPIVRPADHAAEAPVDSVETLLISGNLDVSTPATYATRELLPRLPRGHQVVFHDAGHNDLWEFQGEGYARLVGGFYNSGSIDTSGIAAQTMSLHSRWTLARMAKLTLAGVAIVLGMVVLAARALVRRLRRRRRYA